MSDIWPEKGVSAPYCSYNIPSALQSILAAPSHCLEMPSHEGLFTCHLCFNYLVLIMCTVLVLGVFRLINLFYSLFNSGKRKCRSGLLHLISTSLWGRPRSHLSTNCYLPKSNLTALFPLKRGEMLTQGTIEFGQVLTSFSSAYSNVFLRDTTCVSGLNITYKSPLRLLKFITLSKHKFNCDSSRFKVD